LFLKRVGEEEVGKGGLFVILENSLILKYSILLFKFEVEFHQTAGTAITSVGDLQHYVIIKFYCTRD